MFRISATRAGLVSSLATPWPDLGSERVVMARFAGVGLGGMDLVARLAVAFFAGCFLRAFLGDCFFAGDFGAADFLGFAGMVVIVPRL